MEPISEILQHHLENKEGKMKMLDSQRFQSTKRPFSSLKTDDKNHQID